MINDNPWCIYMEETGDIISSCPTEEYAEDVLYIMKGVRQGFTLKITNNAGWDDHFYMEDDDGSFFSDDGSFSV